MTNPGGNARGAVPAPTHGFVGRKDELALISALLISGPDRLITLIGPGGIGKTRLADEAARRAKAQGVRVYWVPLARLPVDAEFTQVEQATASAVISADFSNRRAGEALEAALRGTDSAGPSRRAVLVLDNGEHVLPALRHLIAQLLNNLPNLTILATSRSPIAWVDERLIPVPVLSPAESLALFRQRCTLIGRSLEWNAADIAAATEICEHITHHPLHIRLAVGRLRYQGLAEMCAELTGRGDDKRLAWSTGARSGADARHLAITNVIAWSYQLCSDKEKLLFTRLSAFAPGGRNPDDTGDTADVGADLDAIVAVCSDEHVSDDPDQVSLSPHEVAGLLESLADKSLVSIHITPCGSRYSMLESLRVYAWDRLRDNDPGEPARLATRHLAYYRDRVVDAARNWFSPRERQLVMWARSTWSNIVAAIETSITTRGEAEAGLQICIGLITLRVPFVRGSIRDIRGLAERCLEASETLTPQPVDLQVELRAALAWLAIRSGQSQEARRLLDQVLPRYLSEPDRAEWADHPDRDVGLPAVIEITVGTGLFLGDEDARAIAIIERAGEKYHAAGNPAEVFAYMFQALAAALLGSAPQAHSIARRAMGIAEASGASWATSWVKLGWAVTLTMHGDPHEATRVLRETLSYQMAFDDQWGAMWSVVLRTWALERMITGDDRGRDWQLAHEIAQTLGGAETLQAHLGVDITAMGSFAKMCRKAQETARGILGDEHFAAETARGKQLNPHNNDVHRLALGELTLSVAPTPEEFAQRGGRTTRNTPLKFAATPWDRLSESEKAVARLAAAGLSNSAIARRRGTSTKTVDGQIAATLAKLDIPNRHHIARHIPENLPENRH